MEPLTFVHALWPSSKLRHSLKRVNNSARSSFLSLPVARFASRHWSVLFCILALALAYSFCDLLRYFFLFSFLLSAVQNDVRTRGIPPRKNGILHLPPVRIAMKRTSLPPPESGGSGRTEIARTCTMSSQPTFLAHGALPARALKPRYKELFRVYVWLAHFRWLGRSRKRLDNQFCLILIASAMGLGIYSLNLTRSIALTLDICKSGSSYKITRILLKYTLMVFGRWKYGNYILSHIWRSVSSAAASAKNMANY